MAPQIELFVCLLAVGCCLIHQCCSKELSKEDKERFAEDVKSCIESSKLPQSEIDAMMKDPKQSAALMTSKEGKCFAKCMYEKSDSMTSDGSLDLVGSKALAEEYVSDLAVRATVMKIIEDCKAAETIIESDACETAAKNIKCMETKFKEAGITEKIWMS